LAFGAGTGFVLAAGGDVFAFCFFAAFFAILFRSFDSILFISNSSPRLGSNF
jgi:hypothetical protein